MQIQYSKDQYNNEKLFLEGITQQQQNTFIIFDYL